MIKSIRSFMKMRRNCQNSWLYMACMALWGMGLVDMSWFNINTSPVVSWISFNAIYESELRGKSHWRDCRKNFKSHGKLLISRTRLNFAFLKTSLCREMNLEEGDVLRFLNLSFSMQNKSFPSILFKKKKIAILIPTLFAYFKMQLTKRYNTHFIL